MTIVPSKPAQDTHLPISDIDPYSDEVLIEPWDSYQALQDLGPAVWLARYQMFALTRYDSVVKALADGSAFSSATGVMMNDDMNQVLRAIRSAATVTNIDVCVASSPNH